MFQRLLKKRRRKQEIEEEFEAHLALESKLLEERGLSRDEAAFRARRSFGNKSVIAEETRQAWVSLWWDRLSQDLRYALRSLLHNRAFTLAAVLSIALGLGATTAVYSIADTVFLRPLPYNHPEQLMWTGVHFTKMKMEFLGSPDYVAWRRDNHVFQNLAATQLSPGETLLLNGHDATEVHNARVSENFLRTFGVVPIMGRDFYKSEELPNGPKAVLLTYHLWQEHFHRNTSLVGKTIDMEGQPFTVAGVLPRGFQFPMDIKLDVLTTLPVAPSASWRDRSVSTWATYGRLKPGITIAQARAALNVAFQRSMAGFPAPFREQTQLALEPLQQHRVGNARLLLSVLIGAVTCLLLIACANVSNLLLARWSARAGEFAVRTAIGAGRMRLARQLLTEATLLTTAGCTLGMLLAFTVLRGFVHYAANEFPRLSEVTVDLRVFIIGLILSVLVTLLFAGLPSLQAGRLDIQRVLQKSERAGLAGGSRLLKRALIAAEMALCLMLLAGAALLLQTLWHLRNDRLGFEPEHVLSISIPLKGTKLESGNRDAVVSELLDFARHIPGVENAAQTECTPLTGGLMNQTFSRSDRPLPEAFHVGDSIHVCGTGSEYAATAGLRILRGRFFTEKDFDHPNTLVVLNETAARRFFPGENAIGKQVLGAAGQWREVIGIVSDSKNLGLDAPAAPQAFFNGVTYPESTKLQFLLRSVGDQHAFESAISSKLHSIDSGLIAEFEPVSKTIAEMSGGARFNAILVGSFAAVAFLMAVIGVYGVLAFAVSQRTQEIGIRIALGGSRDRIFRLVLREGIGPVLVGIIIGVGVIVGLAHYIKAALYGVSATDPFTFGVVVFALTITAAIAISIPAARASRVDPMIALRYQ
ncbi:MAG: ABC transporter permease [Acidobacteriaceae bacterium]|nr:ABC transporter permease [Acidobacteriaceae bacterium]